MKETSTISGDVLFRLFDQTKFSVNLIGRFAFNTAFLKNKYIISLILVKSNLISTKSTLTKYKKIQDFLPTSASKQSRMIIANVLHPLLLKKGVRIVSPFCKRKNQSGLTFMRSWVATNKGIYKPARFFCSAIQSLMISVIFFSLKEISLISRSAKTKIVLKKMKFPIELIQISNHKYIYT